MLQTSPKHWDAVARVVNESHCPVVVPIYTLAPLSTARDWNIVALDFILKLAKDARYTDYEIVMMGDSAGGWMSMRLLQAMCEISCGDKSDRQGDVDDTLMRMGTAIMISPFINSEPTDELIEASKSVSLHPKDAIDDQDCWLSLNLFTFVSRLWVNGPAEYPKLLEAMPTDTKNRYTTLEKHPLYSGEVCLDHNLDIFKTYIKLHPEHGPFRFSTSIGTADMCHAPVLRMQKTFDAMDKKVVVSDTIVVSSSCNDVIDANEIRRKGYTMFMRCCLPRKQRRHGSGSEKSWQLRSGRANEVERLNGARERMVSLKVTCRCR